MGKTIFKSNEEVGKLFKVITDAGYHVINLEHISEKESKITLTRIEYKNDFS